MCGFGGCLAQKRDTLPILAGLALSELTGSALGQETLCQLSLREVSKCLINAVTGKVDFGICGGESPYSNAE